MRGTDRGIDLAGVAESAREAGNLPEGVAPRLGEHVMNMSDVFTFPSGCHVAEVEIDPETGAATLLRYTAVDDYGRLINPMLTEGQVQGGVAQGIGQALLEHTVYDPRLGPAAERLVHGLRPAARRRPAGLRHQLIERPTAANPLGVKGSGQAGCIARAADRDGGGARRAASARRRAPRHAGDPRDASGGRSTPTARRARSS